MSSTKQFLRTALVAAALSGADAFWRLPCRGRSGLGLVDPIVDFNQISGHAHTIHGSSNFGMGATNEDMMAGDCTACGVQEDMSTYWTPPLYFMYPNGTSVMVEQVGGMLAYYLQYGDGLVEFPQGFQMIAGDPNRRNFTCQQPEPAKSLWSGYEVTQDALAQKALGFNCLNYDKTPEPSLGRHGLPTKQFMDDNCKDGMRLELFFPSCWNGKDATAPDHKSHMAYPSLVSGGDCPAGFEKRTVSLFFETIWNTAAFKGIDGEFVVSMGDPTGYGYHGDFMAGWKKDFLQSAIQTCTNPSGEVSDCPLFTLNTEAEMNQCKMPEPPKDAEPQCDLPQQGLPGGVTIQRGPLAAVRKAGGSAPSSPPSSSVSAPARQPSGSASSEPQSAAASRPGSTTGDLVMAQAVTSAPTSSASTPSAAITSAPSAAVGSTEGCSASTTIIKDGVQWNMCIEDVTQTVTAAPAATPDNYKRHLHEHAQHRRAGHAHH